MTVIVDPTLSVATGVTLDDVVSRVKRKLADRDNINKLDGALTDSATSLTMKYSLSTLSRGSLITIDDEVMHVWETSSKTVTVERGYDHTIPVAHDPDSIIYIGGKSRPQIVDAINDELMSLSAKDLYQVRSAPITGFNGGQWAYSLDDIAGSNIYDVQYLETGQIIDWRHVPDWTFSATDNAIIFSNLPLWSNDVRVLYKAGFNKLVDGEDDVQSDGGLQVEAADVLVWGALYRLTIGDEYIRDDFRTQGDTRRPSEVPAGAVLRSTIAGFKALHDERLSEEQDRLRRQFPMRRLGW